MDNSKLLELMNKPKQELVRLLLEKDDILIPVSVFSSQYGPLESVVKYLSEKKKLSIKEIALRLNRSDRTIWATYYAAKRQAILIPTKSRIIIPLSILSKESSSILESLVYYLHDFHSMRFIDISHLINRDIRTVWTCYNRYMKKNHSKPNQKIMLNMEEKK